MRTAALFERHLDARELAAGRFDQDVERRRLADEALRSPDLDPRALGAARPQPRPAGHRRQHNHEEKQFSHCLNLMLTFES